MHVIIMAGGKGTRVGSFSTILPKPLMPLGDRPVLQVVLQQLAHFGFCRVTICIGHLGHLIRSFFGDGSNLGLEISYAVEDRPRGTLGALAGLEGLSDGSFLVVNGDVLTDLNFGRLARTHLSSDELVTVATCRRDLKIDLGVIHPDAAGYVEEFEEKPVVALRVSMGIYAMRPEVLGLIPADRPFGFDDLMRRMLDEGLPVRTFPFAGSWLDLGRSEDFEKADALFEARRDRFLPHLDAAGGDTWRVPLAAPDLGEPEVHALARTVRDGWLTMGPQVERLEAAWRELTGARHAVAVSSGTAALHLAAMASDVRPGDEVLCPTLTFVATAAVFRHLGARVVFVESAGEDDLNLDPEDCMRKIGPRTRALVVVHYGGFPAQVGALAELCRDRGLILIEDAAHALFSHTAVGAGSRVCGTIGRCGSFSLFGNKNITCGEGGMVVTDRDEVAGRIRRLRNHGIVPPNAAGLPYEVAEPGFNYRLDDLRASVALAQLERLPGLLARRRRIFAEYCQRLQGSGVTVPFADRAQGAEFERIGVHILSVLLPTGVDRAAVRENLRAAGVQTSIHYPLIHRTPAFADAGPVQSLPRTERLAERLLTLPLFAGLTSEQLDLVVSALESNLARRPGDVGVAGLDSRAVAAE